MAEFNSCAHLSSNENFGKAEALYNELLSSGKDPFQVMLDMQAGLQENLSKLYPERCLSPHKIETVGQAVEWAREQRDSLNDEFKEFVEALPGVSAYDEKARTSVWKKWKSKYPNIRDLKLADLSADDLAELQYEYIDMLHFFMNVAFVPKLDAKLIFIMYYLKNAENFDRWNNRSY